MRVRRLLIGAAVALAAVVALGAAPIVYVETSCRAPVGPVAETPSAFGIADAGYRRAEGDSYLSYPEWYIVHAYADLAGVTRQSSESAFDYMASITGFWRSLCRSTRAAERVGPVSADQKTTNYIIGLSFTAEMGVIGGWERTIGAVTAWVRGPRRTAEDDFALAFADDYAAFLNQTPWYRYPFYPELRRFWRETPWGRGSIVRGLERRVALTLEYGGKAIYAVGIGALAGLSPADLRIRSVVEPLTAEDLAAEPRIVEIRDLPGGPMLIETPRYQEFTDILRELGARGREALEIAGNQRILVTIRAKQDAVLALSGARELFAIPIQSRPGWRRLGLDVAVDKLTKLIGDVETQGAEFEHAYDY